MALQITDSSFAAEVLESPVPVLVDFWAPWCGPCKMISPIVDQIAVELAGQAKVCKVNVDEDSTQELCNRYNIRSKSEPRCAIGQLGELEYMFVVVDGRRKDSDGCSTEELGQWMFEQGCVQAYNLDGGNSALMWFGGENYSDKTTKNERTVSDFIYISTAVKPEEE